MDRKGDMPVSISPAKAVVSTSQSGNHFIIL